MHLLCSWYNMNFELGILVLYLFSFGGAEIDPCSPDHHSVIPNMGLRYINNRITDDDDIHGDSRLVLGWYKVGAYKMPERSPDAIFRCGTKFPVWLDGKHPTENSIVDGTACQHSVTGSCDRSYAIKIKKCGAFYVYQLPPTSSSKSGYCFGNFSEVKGERSKFKANQPLVNFTLITRHVGDRDLPISRVHFRCNFSPSPTEELHYLVIWYGGGAQLYNAPLSQQADDDALLLDEETFVANGFKMGQHITCSVHAFNIPKGPAGPRSEFAKHVYVGIEVLTPSLTFVSDEKDESKRTIRLRPTVPIGCSGTESCRVQLFTYTAKNTERVCEKIAVQHSVCGIEIDSVKYDDVLELVIKTQEQNKEYQKAGQYDIFLRTEDTDENEIWKNYELPRIPVNLKPGRTDPLYQGKDCRSFNDPHIKTFDGRSYDNHQSGVYTMYKHLVYDAEIQIKFSICGRRYVKGEGRIPIMCNCGFAARIGVTLYIIDVCDGKLDFNYKFCGDEALTVTARGETEFTFTFIYGTYGKVTVDRRWDILTVDIYPSSHDIDNTRGLCGIMDSDCNNDFHYRHESDDPGHELENGACNDFTDWQYVFEHQPHRFLDSWKAKPEEDLFGSFITLDDLKPFDSYKACVCLEPENQSTKLMNEIPCIKDSVAQCSAGSHIVGTHSCTPKTRSRRSVHNAPKIPEIRIENKLSRWKREVTEENNWTESEAKAFCQQFMDRSQVFHLCEEVPNVRPHSSVENCVMDVMLTGDTDWSEISLETMQNGCLEEVQRNTTLRKKTANNKISLAEKIEENACPKNCSEVGICDKGKCTCSPGWGGHDCSIDLTVGPAIHGLLDNGLCDEQEFVCDHAYVFGQIFTQSPNLTCRLEEFTLSESGTKTAHGSHYFPGQFETMIEVVCPLQHARRRPVVLKDEFIVGFTISVSNDGHLYEPGKDLFIYDSECQNVQNISNQMDFSLKDGYCFIDGRCVYRGDKSPSNTCFFCNHSESTHTWSADTLSPECLPSTSSTSPPVSEAPSEHWVQQYLYLIIIAAAVVVIIIAVCTVALLCKCRSAQRKSESQLVYKQNSNDYENQTAIRQTKLADNSDFENQIVIRQTKLANSSDYENQIVIRQTKLAESGSDYENQIVIRQTKLTA